jgi:hypothetical protein
VLRQMPETIRDTSQLESHPAENAALSINPHPACVERHLDPWRRLARSSHRCGPCSKVCASNTHRAAHGQSRQDHSVSRRPLSRRAHVARPPPVSCATMRAEAPERHGRGCIALSAARRDLRRPAQSRTHQSRSPFPWRLSVLACRRPGGFQLSAEVLVE